MRRLTFFENRKDERVVLGDEPDRFAPLSAVVMAVRILAPVIVPVAMPVTAPSQRKQRADGDPAPEADERDAGKHRSDVPELGGDRDAGDPHDEPYEQRRNSVPRSGQSCRPSDFAFCPALLARDEGD